MIVIRSSALRRILRTVIPFVLIPALVLLGALLFREQNYALITVLVTALTLLLFVTGFEKKKIGSRRLILASVMTALSVVGRFIPLFKPITALTVLTAIYLGGETGFLVGSLSALISNFSFGQGPWTPFQMFAWGMIGLIAGFLAKPLKRSRFWLIVYGILSGVLYSMILDVWTVLWYNGTFDWTLYLAAVGTALPHMILYAVSNAIFLWLFAKPFGDKLDRVKLKYGV